MTEQRQLIEILAQAKGERDKALEQAKRALEYKPVELSNDPPFLTTMNLMAMSVGLEKIEQSQDSNDTPFVPSHAQTMHTEPDNSSHLKQLLDEYTRLQKNLIDEIHSEQYIIQQDSRERLKTWVDNGHNDEVRRLTVIYPYVSDANGKFKESGKPQIQPTRVGGLGEIDAEIDAEDSLQVDFPDNFEREPTDRKSHLSSQQNEITAIMPRPPLPEPELKKTEDGILSLQPQSILREPRDGFPEYPTTTREGVAPEPSQLIKKDIQKEICVERLQRPLSPLTIDPLLPKLVVILSTAVNLPDIATGPIPPQWKPAIPLAYNVTLLKR